MRLNLGSGSTKIPGFIGVDRWGSPDVRWDLESFPWPWKDGEVEEIRMIHVLEHLGQTPGAYIGILKELFRVCRHRARILVVVPHPRHDFFLNDPTHVRPITPDGLRLFSQRLNREWERIGASNSRLGLEHGINFEVIDVEEIRDPRWEAVRREVPHVFFAAKDHQNNVLMEYKITLEVIKE